MALREHGRGRESHHLRKTGHQIETLHGLADEPLRRCRLPTEPTQ